MSQRLAHAHQTNTPVMMRYKTNSMTALARFVGSEVNAQLTRVQYDRRIRLPIKRQTATIIKNENMYMLLFIIAC